MEKNYIHLYLGNLEKSHRHLHEDLECLLVINGKLEVEVDGNTSCLNQDDMIIINMDQVHSIKGNKENIVLMLSIEKNFFQTEYKELLSKTIQCDSSKACEGEAKIYYECKRILTRMLLIYTEKKTGYHLEFQAVFYLFLHYITIHFLLEETKQLHEISSSTDKALEEVLLYIQSNYDKSFSLDAASSMVFMSPPYFSKYFKRKMGIGFLEYLTKIRLKEALQALVYTEQSILKIAMSNGFSNAKSFTTAFKKEYGDNPSEYRKKHQQRHIGDAMEDRHHTFDIKVEDSLIAFLKYLHQHNTDQTLDQSKIKKYKVDVEKSKSYLIQKPDYIINIEHMHNIKKAEILEQLKELKGRLNFNYIYFRAFDEADSFSYHRGDNFSYYEPLQMVKSIYALNLIPIISLDYSTIRRVKQWTDPTKEFTVYLLKVFQILLKQFPDFYISKWKLELGYSNPEDHMEFLTFYKKMNTIFADFLEEDGIGILSFQKHNLNEKQNLELLLHYAKEQLCIPGFISFYAYPEEHLYHIFSENYGKIDGYHHSVIQELKEINHKTGCNVKHFFMTKWNTLAGKNMAETGKFFRSALIFDTYWSMINHISAFGVHLNTVEVSNKKEKIDTSVLALYLYYKIRRPVFFILEALERIGNEVIIKNDHVFVTKKGDNEYAVLFFHTCYVNPSLSIDPIFIKENNIQIELELSGLSAGKYQVKTFLLDQDNAGVFNRWEHAGFPDFMDSDVVEYLERAVIPNLIVKDVTIDTTYCLKEEMTFNGVVFSLIRKQS